ncbi:D-inositol-3-phosphate glycosyltransferase [Jatrophihabitans endophyticus]|uniref:D-inositol-3-phosphate glycosyltransferase n=1 Tax=Jatrophihabitans endophyticus TaxID=1206085 RepID=UPI0019EC28C2|nr:D-inositol-3-phosphate glycosyltransferase [Jatrophihabitans endophyticus]
MLSVHTSPLDAPGGGDAGGMNVYIVETARRLAARGLEVEIFTRATSSDQPAAVELTPGVVVRHVTAGPFEGLAKAELPSQLCAFTAGVLREEARHAPGWYDLVHSHYWLSGQVGWLARERWGVPLVHSAHTLAKVKNRLLAEGDDPEPYARVVGEQQVADESDRLVASTPDEARDLVGLYGADPGRVDTIAPGVDLDVFTPGPAAAARARLGLRPDALTLLFVGRIQPLKAPDVLLRVAALLDHDPALAGRLEVVVLGAPSGSGLAHPHHLEALAGDLGLAGSVRFRPPVARDVVADYYRAADLTVVPSYTESFGLVALESQACGTPVAAAAVGGLPTAVADGVSGVLVDGHDPQVWAGAVGGVLRSPEALRRLADGARAHAERFSWARTAAGLHETYEAAVGDLRLRRELAIR